MRYSEVSTPEFQEHDFIFNTEQAADGAHTALSKAGISVGRGSPPTRVSISVEGMGDGYVDRARAVVVAAFEPAQREGG